MLKSMKNKDKLSVRWSTQDNTTTTTTITRTTATASIKTKDIEQERQIKAIESNVANKDKLRDNEALAEATLAEAKAAIDAAKIAVDAANATNGKYTNWNNKHAELAAHAWCCIGDLLEFCHRYEFKSISRNDTRMQNAILVEVKALLHGSAPFGMRQRFPGNIRNPENLWVCIGRCAGIEYHLNRILSAFRKPLEQLSTDKQRLRRQNFHLAVNELHLDITARVLDLRLYDRAIFENEFQLLWQNDT